MTSKLESGTWWVKATAGPQGLLISAACSCDKKELCKALDYLNNFRRAIPCFGRMMGLIKALAAARADCRKAIFDSGPDLAFDKAGSG